jgi:tellurite resistance protein TerC
LLVTAVLIGGSMLVSMIKTRGLPRDVAAAEAVHGWVPGSPLKPRAAEETEPPRKKNE